MTAVDVAVSAHATLVSDRETDDFDIKINFVS